MCYVIATQEWQWVLKLKSLLQALMKQRYLKQFPLQTYQNFLSYQRYFNVHSKISQNFVVQYLTSCGNTRNSITLFNCQLNFDNDFWNLGTSMDYVTRSSRLNFPSPLCKIFKQKCLVCNITFTPPPFNVT